MAYQINLTGQEIDERLQNVGTPADNPDANGTLFARLNKNVDDVDALNDSVAHIQDAQTATDKVVAQHTADINTLQTAVGNNKTEQGAIAQKVEKNATAIGKHTTTLTEHDARQTNIEKVVLGAQEDAYFSLLRLNFVFNNSCFNGDIDNVEVRLYRWSGKRYARFEMFTRNNTGGSQKSIGYEIILKQIKEDGANVRIPYIHYNDDGTEEWLWDAVKNAFGGRISYGRHKKRRWRLQAFLNGRPITAPFDFRVSIAYDGSVSLTKGGMMRSVPKAKEVVYDGNFNGELWLAHKKGEQFNIVFFEGEETIERFPMPGDPVSSTGETYGAVVAVKEKPTATAITYNILWTNGVALYEIGVLEEAGVLSYTCTSPAKKLCDNIYDYASKMNSGTLRDLYISAGAKYNEATGFYELNGLTDITEEEMRVIYDRTWGWWIALPNIAGFGSSYPRTNIPCPDYKAIVYKGSCNISSCFNNGEMADNLEVLNFRPRYLPSDSVFDQIKVSSMNWLCQGNKKPITVIGIINTHYVSDNNSLNIGGNIKSINIKNLSKNIRFYGSSVLSKESVLYMINNSEGTNAFTIVLNKAVYDVMKDDADIIAALAEKTNITLVQNT